MAGNLGKGTDNKKIMKKKNVCWLSMDEALSTTSTKLQRENQNFGIIVVFGYTCRINKL